ncbi:MAG TPA: hypothetical protein VNH18_05645 [Bryobacteraceae bacterium]|nr:hypothetical protein [Bryobacteraceae bacterium]
MTGTQGYIAISRRPLDLEDYVDVARRHVGWIVAPMFAGIVTSIVVAYLLPNTYVSKAVMQIVPAQISEHLVPTTINQQLTERIQQMEGNILSRTSLSNLIQAPDLDLYKKERASKPLEDVIESMKLKDLRIDINNAAQTLLTKHASSFTIQFSYSNRFKARDTVQKLISRFIDENTNAQRSQQNLLKDFFGDELTQAKANLEKANEEMAKFQTQNQGRLPEQTQQNMVALTSIQAQVQRINDELNRLAQSKVALEQHITTLGHNQELVTMMEKDTSSLSLNSPIVKQNEELLSMNKQIEQMETQLALLLQSYRETYPEIRDMRKRLGVVKRQRDELVLKHEKELEEAVKATPKEVKKPTNYAAAKAQNDIQGQIDQAQTQIKLMEQDRQYKLKDLEKFSKEMEDYRNRLSQAALITARYSDLQRDQRNAAEKFQVMLGKSEMTAQNSDLIQRKANETLEVLDPPSLPVNPSNPNRLLIIGAGIAISFMLGLALAGVQEAKDTSLKNLKDVRAYTNLPVLCSIPLLENTVLLKRKKRIAYLAWSAAVIVGIIAISAALFYYYSVTLTA